VRLKNSHTLNIFLAKSDLLAMNKININIANALYVESIHPEDRHMYVCEAMPLQLAHPNPSSVLDLIDVPI
jgi:hypothetical protein